MSPIFWMESFKIGHEAIDRDHRELLEAANALEAELAAGHFAAANALCHALRDRLQTHFAREEKLLRDAEFPRIQDHIGTHAAAQRAIEAILGECCENCQIGLKIGCPTRWCYTVVDHVLMADLDFKSHLQNKDIARRE